MRPAGEPRPLRRRSTDCIGGSATPWEACPWSRRARRSPHNRSASSSGSTGTPVRACATPSSGTGGSTPSIGTSSASLQSVRHHPWSLTRPGAEVRRRYSNERGPRRDPGPGPRSTPRRPGAGRGPRGPLQPAAGRAGRRPGGATGVWPGCGPPRARPPCWRRSPHGLDPCGLPRRSTGPPTRLPATGGRPTWAAPPGARRGWRGRTRRPAWRVGLRAAPVTRRTGCGGPWPGGSTGSPGRRGSACAAGSRGSWRDAGCSAGRCACSLGGSRQILIGLRGLDALSAPRGVLGAPNGSLSQRQAWHSAGRHLDLPTVRAGAPMGQTAPIAPPPGHRIVHTRLRGRRRRAGTIGAAYGFHNIHSPGERPVDGCRRRTTRQEPGLSRSIPSRHIYHMRRVPYHPWAPTSLLSRTAPPHTHSSAL